jgi:hypothetical protein
MRITYAVSWQEADGLRCSGRLELGSDAARFEGRSNGAGATRIVRYQDIERLRLARSSGDRLQGRPTLVLELTGGNVVKVASVAQPGIVGELLERLVRLADRPHPVERAALVVPLRPGAKAEAEALLRAGPPFDPSEFGLEAHEVYVTDDEVVFVFEGVPSVFVEQLAADETISGAAEAWRSLIDGRIRYADETYAWSR